MTNQRRIYRSRSMNSRQLFHTIHVMFPVAVNFVKSRNLCSILLKILYSEWRIHEYIWMSIEYAWRMIEQYLAPMSILLNTNEESYIRFFLYCYQILLLQTSKYELAQSTNPNLIWVCVYIISLSMSVVVRLLIFCNDKQIMIP